MMVLREVPAENIARPLGRNEVIGLLFRLTIFGAVTYFTIKWMVDAIDPTRKQKVEAQKQVRLGSSASVHNEVFRSEPQRGGVVDPSLLRDLMQAEKLMKQIGVKNVKLSEYEMSIAAHLVDPLSMQVMSCYHKPEVYDKKNRPHDRCVCICVCVCRSRGGTLLVWMM